jgi:isoamylase
VLRLRHRMLRNFFATLAFSQGVPMISHGDELGRTQLGNNNAYCHDSELTWVNWDADQRAKALLAFVRKVFRIRKNNPVFRRRRYFSAEPDSADRRQDVQWLRPDGVEMRPEDWSVPQNRCFGMLIHGDASDEVDERGRPNLGETLYLAFNGGYRAASFALPAPPLPGYWHETINTAAPQSQRVLRGQDFSVSPHALVLLTCERA